MATRPKDYSALVKSCLEQLAHSQANPHFWLPKVKLPKLLANDAHFISLKKSVSHSNLHMYVAVII